jgi:hypothetical protein
LFISLGEAGTRHTFAQATFFDKRLLGYEAAGRADSSSALSNRSYIGRNSRIGMFDPSESLACIVLTEPDRAVIDDLAF